MAGLFQDLLGAGFTALHPRVRAVHAGVALTLRGTATIIRGRSWVARIACRLAVLPRDQAEGPLRVQIEKLPDGERWTRHFGASPPMRSTLRARDGLLVESLGLTTMTFRLRVRDGAIDWDLVRVALLGLPLPAALFNVTSTSGIAGDRYRFVVNATLARVGPLIRYEGELDVIAS